eukprot:TRINITY_DN3252_c0_g2_i6.p2 TRINITY_DN3252_c0_g2~~TRINITY_DN3252_c0_g2_i6.p2  ORF type:complete len:132 (+),score=29.89 TRINITY_DN3252_c0_g2_i6:156-551(+)
MSEHSILYDENGDFFIFGNGQNGQLGLGNVEHQNEIKRLMNDPFIKTIKTGMAHTIFYKITGDLMVMGGNIFGQLGLDKNGKQRKNLIQTKPELIMNDKNIKNVYSGDFFSIIEKYNGDLFSFGINNKGQK